MFPTYSLIFQFPLVPLCMLCSVGGCAQRGGSLPQAGASQRLGREPNDAVPHIESYESRPACGKLLVGGWFG